MHYKVWTSRNKDFVEASVIHSKYASTAENNPAKLVG